MELRGHTEDSNQNIALRSLRSLLRALHDSLRRGMGSSPMSQADLSLASHSAMSMGHEMHRGLGSGPALSHNWKITKEVDGGHVVMS